MILITGANGFIGKNLFNFYKDIRGEKVLGFDKNFHLSFLDENIENLEFFDFVKDGRAEFIERFLSKLEEAEDKHLKIYHLASEVGVNFHDKTTFKSQMILNSNIYEILLELKHQGFKIDLAYASSSEVYGEVDDIDDIQCGQTRLLAIDRKPIFDKPERNEYILQKLFAEKLFDNLRLNSFSIQRFFNVFGYGQNSKKGFNAIIVDRIYNENNVSSEPLIINKNSSRTYTLIDEAVVKMVDDFESNIGSEYTSVENIMKVIKPLFLDELTSKFQTIVDKINENEDKDTTERTKRENRTAYQNELTTLHERLSNIKFFDPACGSGGMFVQSVKFKDAHQKQLGRKGDLAVYGQEMMAESNGLRPLQMGVPGHKRILIFICHH